MRLTPRLQAIADKVPPGSVVADIGSDHAYIPLYLLTHRLVTHVIVSDNKHGPLRAARDTLELFNCAKAADLRLGDGLSVLRPEDEVNAVVLAGMGGETICSILERGQGILSPGTRLILQAMTDTGLVRSWLVKNGYSLVQEDIAQEGESYYEIVVAEKDGQIQDFDAGLLAVGPLLVAQRHPLLKPMLEQRLMRVRRAHANVNKSSSQAARERSRVLAERIKRLEEVLAWL